jgi:spermidine/putrescine-binding protein
MLGLKVMMRIRNRMCPILLALALAALSAVPARAEEEKVLNVYNWSD